MTARRYTDAQVRGMRERAAAGENHLRLAAEYGCSQPAIGQIVRGHVYRDAGGPILPDDPARGRWRPGAPGTPALQWTPAWDDLLGTMSDQQVAAAIGCSARSVMRRRNALGIRPWRDIAHGEVLDAADMVGAERHEAVRGGLSVTALAERDGVTVSAICMSIREYWRRRAAEILDRRSAS